MFRVISLWWINNHKIVINRIHSLYTMYQQPGYDYPQAYPPATDPYQQPYGQPAYPQQYPQTGF